MKSPVLLIASAALGLAAFSAGAANPHPSPLLYAEGELNVSCTCDWTAGSCDVSWTDLASLGVVGVPVAYGADVEFEASWVESDVEMEASSEADVDEYTCDGLTCTGTVDVVLPVYPAEADLSFEAKVKGFETGRDGPKSRDFIKDTAECNLPE